MNAAIELFPCSSPFLTWLPDETLFSLCSRLHRLWGYANAGKTAQILFGAPRAGLQHDLPNRLARFVDVTSGAYGSPHELAQRRTLLKYYRPFFPGAVIEEATNAMAGNSVAHLKFRLGLLTSRFRANHQLKACPDCMRADLEAYGWCYWHLSHQYPGVWMCAIHGALLRSSNQKATGVGRFQWHSPDKSTLVAPIADLRGEDLARVGKFSETVASLVARSTVPGSLQLEVVRPALLERAAAQSWVTSAGRLRMSDAAPAYAAHCRPLTVLPEFSRLPMNQEASCNQLGLIFHPSSRSAHPLRVLLAIDWLFGREQPFIRAYESPVRPPAQPRRAAHAVGSDPDADPARHRDADELLRLVREGASISAAAAAVGVAVETAMAWAAANGIQVARRPKKLLSEHAQSLMDELRTGADKQVLAQRYAVSVETVTRVLRTHPGLQAAWHAARFANARRDARAAWDRICKNGVGIGVKLLRAQEPAAYAWLYRNDRSWLQQHTPPKAGRDGEIRRASVRWDERDSVISQAVQRAALMLRSKASSKPLKLWQLYQVVPELKAKLRSLHRLPLTQRVLKDVLERPSDCGDDLFS